MPFIMNGKNVSEEEIQYEVSLNILEEQRFYLCKYLEPQNHFAYLRSKHLLTAEDEEVIKFQISRKQRAEKFLDILLQKEPMCYMGLVDAILKNGTQTFIVTKLNQEYERKKIQLHNLLTGSKPVDPNANIDVDPDCLPEPKVGTLLYKRNERIPVETPESKPSSLESDKLSYREDSQA